MLLPVKSTVGPKFFLHCTVGTGDHEEEGQEHEEGSGEKDGWTKSQNPKMFGGCTVLDNTGKIISVEISAFGFVAEFFEGEEIQTRLIEAFRKNNIVVT